MEKFIPLSVPNLKGNELKYVSEAIDAEWVSTGGSYIQCFESEFAKYAKVHSVAAVQSGTAALHLAMLSCNVGVGDLVIAPTLTFIAAINPISYVGAQPVFMDCDDSLCLDAEKLQYYLEKECTLHDGIPYDNTLGKPIKAIVVVHIFGNVANMEHIMEIAQHYSLPVIEDAAEAVGTFYTQGKYKGHMAGAIGDYGGCSFNGNKIITTGGGGIFLARDIHSVQHAKHLSTQAKIDEVYFEHDEVGYNYRMTNIQAAMGVAQLEQLEKFINIKRENYKYYQQKDVFLLPFRDNIRPNYWFYSHVSEDRDGLIKYLASNNIQARPVWQLIHTLSMYKQCKAYEIEKAMQYYAKIINIPCSSNLTIADMNRVINCLMDFRIRKS